MSAPPASIPEHWMMCKTGRQFRAAVAGSPQARLPTSVGLMPTNHGDDQLVLSKDDIPVAPDHGSEDEGPYMRMRRAVERVDGSSVDGEW